jgi:hypothetical protein
MAVAAAQDPCRLAQMRTRARVEAEQIDWESIFDQVESVLFDVIRRGERVQA